MTTNEIKKTKTFKRLALDIAKAIAKREGMKLAQAKILVAAKPEVVVALMDQVMMAAASLETSGETKGQFYRNQMDELERLCK